EESRVFRMSAAPAGSRRELFAREPPQPEWLRAPGRPGPVRCRLPAQTARMMLPVRRRDGSLPARSYPIVDPEFWPITLIIVSRPCSTGLFSTRNPPARNAIVKPLCEWIELPDAHGSTPEAHEGNWRRRKLFEPAPGTPGGSCGL